MTVSGANVAIDALREARAVGDKLVAETPGADGGESRQLTVNYPVAYYPRPAWAPARG